MPTVMLAKQYDTDLTEDQRSIMRSVIFEMFKGCTNIDHKKWIGIWRELMAAGAGEVFTINVTINRSGYFHRRHMLLEQKFFDNQEIFYSFKMFRDWLKTGAGFVDWHVVRGMLIPEPKSISYEECDQIEMEIFHNDAVAFLRTRRAQSELYPHLSPDMAERAVESLLGSFERQD